MRATMPRGGRWTLLLLTACLSGCYGVSGNPQFPYLFPEGDIVRTHAKPGGPGYFADFDKRACRLSVRPADATAPARARAVLIATVTDAEGNPLKNRRVEWLLEGAGSFIEVDESGIFPGRGYKVDNRYAVSYTDHHKHTISPRTGRPQDDFTIEPGQSWCVVSSAVEGDTQVSVYAPEIANWDHNRVVINLHWLDAEWKMPPPVATRFGTQTSLITSVARASDHQPLTFYRVRYKVLDGPPLVLIPPGSSARTAMTTSASRDPSSGTVVMTDLSGKAGVGLYQPSPQAGKNRVAVEIIRAPDPRTPSGAAIVIAHAETTVEWQAPVVTLSETAPPTVPVGQEVPYTYTLTNSGAVASEKLTVRTSVPAGLQYARSEPEAKVDGDQLVWGLDELAAGKSRELKAVFKSTRTGQVVSRSTVVTGEGIKDEKTVATEIAPPPVPHLEVSMTGPTNAMMAPHDVGPQGQSAVTPIAYQVTIRNSGTGPAQHVIIKASFDKSLEHDSKQNPIQLTVGELAAGASRTVGLTLKAVKSGEAMCHVTATGDGGLTASADHAVLIYDASLTVHLTGPDKRYVGRPVTWEVEVGNAGDQPLTQVIVRDLLPPELDYVSAGEGGQLQGREVVWQVGNLKPGEVHRLELTTKAAHLGDHVVNQAVASAAFGIEGMPAPGALQARSEAALAIEGMPALRLSVKDTDDPIEVNGKTTYQINVSNTGSQVDGQIALVCTVPDTMRILSVTGSVRYRLDGQRVTFEPLATLPPNQSVPFTIEVQALKAGGASLRAELTSTGQREPIVRVETTNVR
jgi:uncharacterized repeat protein (TIGR01451 family)